MHDISINKNPITNSLYYHQEANVLIIPGPGKFITTESGLDITTESGVPLITEG